MSPAVAVTLPCVYSFNDYSLMPQATWKYIHWVWNSHMSKFQEEVNSSKIKEEIMLMRNVRILGFVF